MALFVQNLQKAQKQDIWQKGALSSAQTTNSNLSYSQSITLYVWQINIMTEVARSRSFCLNSSCGPTKKDSSRNFKYKSRQKTSNGTSYIPFILETHIKPKNIHETMSASTTAMDNLPGQDISLLYPLSFPISFALRSLHFWGTASINYLDLIMSIHLLKASLLVLPLDPSHAPGMSDYTMNFLGKNNELGQK